MSTVARLPEELQIYILSFAARDANASPFQLRSRSLHRLCNIFSISFDAYHTISIAHDGQVAPFVEFVESKPLSFFALRTRGLFLQFDIGEGGRAWMLAAWETLWQTTIPKLTNLRYLYADEIRTMPSSTMKLAFSALQALAVLRSFFLGWDFRDFLLTLKPFTSSWPGAFVSITHLQLSHYRDSDPFDLSAEYIDERISLLRQFKRLTHLMFTIYESDEVDCAVQIMKAFTSLEVIALFIPNLLDMPLGQEELSDAVEGEKSNAIIIEYSQSYHDSLRRFKEATYGFEGNIWVQVEQELAAKRRLSGSLAALNAFEKLTMFSLKS
ncbi:hypothetical protein DL96DRAFT_1817320 [Flagelloscypha sp. PMI_526]|nr:hypothetical protein DL96DRAFT_1817320 [Flagelloscypha sp. PMI_526]